MTLRQWFHFHAQSLRTLHPTLSACPINVCEHCSSLHAPLSASTAAHCMPHQCLQVLQLTLSACPINVCEYCSSLHAPMPASTAAHSLCMPQRLRAVQLSACPISLRVLQLSACPINVCENCSSLSLHAPSLSVSTAAHCMPHQCL